MHTLLLLLPTLQSLMTEITDVVASKAEPSPRLEPILMVASVHSGGLRTIFLLVDLARGAPGPALRWAPSAFLFWDIHRLGSYLGPFFLFYLLKLP